MKQTVPPHLKIRSARLMKSLLLGSFKAAFSGKGIEFQDFRSYSYGDDARSIDWATSTREGTTLIRRYHEEKDASILCIADMTASLDFYTGAEKKKCMNECIELIAQVSVSSGESFGGYQIFETARHYIPARKSLLSLAAFQKQTLHVYRNPETPLDVSFLLREVRKRSIIFVISDSMNIDIKSFQQTALKHDIIFISLSSHFENTLEGEGISLFRGNTGVCAIDLDDTEKKKQYQEARKQQQEDFRKMLQGYTIDCLFVDETTPLTLHFLRLMQTREHKKNYHVSF